ncbi:hypothetical protein BS17DRAFT_784507 [Gyrodon lividus]|nr:hypothetical protein BS17DRAFT_784507 [Gyrodon lividus]
MQLLDPIFRSLTILRLPCTTGPVRNFLKHFLSLVLTSLPTPPSSIVRSHGQICVGPR